MFGKMHVWNAHYDVSEVFRISAPASSLFIPPPPQMVPVGLCHNPLWVGWKCEICGEESELPPHPRPAEIMEQVWILTGSRLVKFTFSFHPEQVQFRPGCGEKGTSTPTSS
jgi:hypothetical protein